MMRKLLLFGVVLLLILSLPTVSMAGSEEKETDHTVTFAGHITGTGICKLYEHKKIIIEWRPIDLTFDASITGFGGSHSGRFYLKIWKGETKVEYYFGSITGGKYDGFPQYVLAGSGEWNDATKTITCTAEPYTIYELTWKGQGKVKTYDQQWAGFLTFTIVMVPV